MSELEEERELEKLCLSQRKRDLLTEICYLREDEHKQYGLYSKVKLALAKAKMQYAKVDLELALLDRRLSVVEEIKLEERKKVNHTDIIKGLSPEERSKLYDELTKED